MSDFQAIINAPTPEVKLEETPIIEEKDKGEALPLEKSTKIEEKASAIEPSPKPSKTEPIRSFKLKVDGEEKELAEPDLIKHAQKGMAAEKRFEEAAKLRKEAEKLQQAAREVLDIFPDDPQSAFLDAYSGKNGTDRQKAYAKWLEICQEVVVRDWEFKNLPEAERRALSAQKEAEELRNQLAMVNQQKEAERISYEEGVRMKKHAEGIVAAFSARGIPVSDDALDSVISKLVTLREAGFDPTYEDAVELHTREEEANRKRLKEDEIKKLPLAEILELYPELKKMVSEDTLAKAKAAKSSPPKREPASAAPEVFDGRVTKKPLAMSEFYR